MSEQLGKYFTALAQLKEGERIEFPHGASPWRYHETREAAIAEARQMMERQERGSAVAIAVVRVEAVVRTERSPIIVLEPPPAF